MNVEISVKLWYDQCLSWTNKFQSIYNTGTAHKKVIKQYKEIETTFASLAQSVRIKTNQNKKKSKWWMQQTDCRKKIGMLLAAFETYQFCFFTKKNTKPKFVSFLIF